MTSAIALYREMLADMRRIAGRASVARACAEDGRPAARSDRGLSRRRCGAARFRRRLLEPGESEDLSLQRRRRWRGCAPAEAAPATALVDRYHLCFALGKALEDRGEIAEVLALLRARQCPEARGKPLSPRDHRDQHGANRSKSARGISSSAAPGWGDAAPRSDLHPRPAAFGLDPARADSGLAFRRWKARRNWRTSSGSCSICRAAIPTWTIRAIRRRWRT